MSKTSLCFLVFRHGHACLLSNSAFQRLAIIALLLLQLLVLLSEVLSDPTIAESTASRIDALLSLVFIIPALLCSRISQSLS